MTASVEHQTVPKSRAAPTAPDLAWPVAIGTGICFGFRRALKAGRMSPVAVRKTRRPGARRAAARRDTVKPAPRVGLVSLGCPKAMVDSERIITRLRAEGYQLSADYAGADVVVVNTCGFLNSAKQESLDAIGEAMAKNGRVVVTGCFGVEKERILAAHPGVLAVTGPHQYEQVVEAVHEAVPPLHDPFLDLVPPEGLHLTPAPLRVSEDFRGLQQPLLVLHHPQPARAARQPPRRPGDERGRTPGEGGRQGAAGHQPGHLRLRPRHQIRREHVEGANAARRASWILRRRWAQLGAWVRLHYVYPYPHVDAVLPLMAEGKILPYLDIPFQHASPGGAQSHASARAPGKDARSPGPLARDLSRSGGALHLHRRLSRRDRGGFCVAARLAQGGAGSRASAASSTRRSTAPPPTGYPGRLPRRSRRSAGIASWRRSRR